MSKFFLSVAALLLSCVIASAQTPPAPSRWVNQRGSELLVLTADGQGGFSGYFTNRAAGFGCQNQPYAATGKPVQNKFYFVVTFPECNTVTVWRSIIVGNTIRSYWDLSYVDSAGTLRRANGTDVFTRAP